MNLDVDFLINFFEKNSSDTKKSELGEQDAAGGGSTASAKPVPKWADIVGGPARGVANSLPLKGKFWRDIHGGPKRGVANTLW